MVHTTEDMATETGTVGMATGNDNKGMTIMMILANEGISLHGYNLVCRVGPHDFSSSACSSVSSLEKGKAIQPYTTPKQHHYG